jgi:hypothetical protein
MTPQSRVKNSHFLDFVEAGRNPGNLEVRLAPTGDMVCRRGRQLLRPKKKPPKGGLSKNNQHQRQ